MKKLLLLLIALWTGLLVAEGLTQKLLDADNLSVGNRFQLEIRADVNLKSVVVPDTLTIFHVVGWQKVEGKQSPDWLKVTIVPLFPGSHSFPMLEVRPADSAAESFYTDRFRLNIIPVRAEADTLLVDIKPVEKYPFQLPWWLYYLLFGLALAMLLIVLFHKPRPPKPAAEVTPKPPMPSVPDAAWKMALSSLEELIAEELMFGGQYKLHHFRLSEIMRVFLGRKYRFGALEMSTSEIDWVTQRIRVDEAGDVISFLKYCDRVKFAKYEPSLEETYQAEDWLRNWLRSFELEEARQRMSTVGGGDA